MDSNGRSILFGIFVCIKGRKERGFGGDGEKRFCNYLEGIDNWEQREKSCCIFLYRGVLGYDIGMD